ncbi:MAG: 50S ribosomal protein L14e [Nanoarchaeota archaeon]
MTLFNVGRLCVKIAGRDAGNKCVVVEQLDNHYVVVDGATRRKKVNVKHLEPLAETIKIKEKAAHSEVKAIFEKLGFNVWDKKSKTPGARPKKQKVKREKLVKEKKAEKPKVVKKEKVKEEKNAEASNVEENKE